MPHLIKVDGDEENDEDDDESDEEKNGVRDLSYRSHGFTS